MIAGVGRAGAKRLGAMGARREAEFLRARREERGPAQKPRRKARAGLAA
jgi:hypothetical protein